tara:strand:- start:3048 stop:3818 length:771 start_codon:yes stop_codon:yes gene_type:complete
LQKPKKSLGQNFLIDKNISNKIVNSSSNIKKNNVIEIGPGNGALTDFIISKKPTKLILIEKDKYLFLNLKNKYKNFKFVKIYNCDALKFNYNKISKPKTIISNLPYNVSIKLIVNWIKEIKDYSEIICMIQKEVANKLNYKLQKKNRLNTLTDLLTNYEILFNVSNNVFYPKPKIQSSVIKLTYKKNLIKNFDKLEIFTRILFQKKRKKIMNVLPKNIIEEIKKSQKLKYDKLINLRAEDLNINEIKIIFKIFSRI